MATGITASGYNVLAANYDVLMKDVPYPRWVEFISKYACRQGKPRITDVGCGTGTVALALARRGFEVTGIDQSVEMLAMARHKSDRENIPVSWIHGSFAQLNLTSDIIISTCDGVNHLLSIRELCQFLVHARSCLTAQGVLIFDINSESKFSNVLADNTFYWQEPGIEVVWVNDYSPPFNYANITLFELSNSGNYSKSTMMIIERCYRLPSLLYYLRRTGFSRISLWNNYKGRLRGNDASRITIVAHK